MKVKNKKQLKSVWSKKIYSVRHVYNIAKKHQKDLPKFTETAGYKDLKKREKRALKRWDNRKQINRKQREYRYKIKQLENSDLKTISDEMSVFESFSGKGRIFEDAIIQKNKGRDFAGSIITIDYDGYETINNFTQYATFRRAINKILSSLYNKKEDVYGAFRWSIERKFQSSEKTLLLKYIFTENEPQ